MLFTYLSTKEDPLMTIGDAITSFLDKQDAATKDAGLLTIHNCSKRYIPGPSPWRNPHWRWKDAINRRRRIVVFVLYVFYLNLQNIF
jgi:hypothetical protein